MSEHPKGPGKVPHLNMDNSLKKSQESRFRMVHGVVAYTKETLKETLCALWGGGAGGERTLSKLSMVPCATTVTDSLVEVLAPGESGGKGGGEGEGGGGEGGGGEGGGGLGAVSCLWPHARSCAFVNPQPSSPPSSAESISYSPSRAIETTGYISVHDP